MRVPSRARALCIRVLVVLIAVVASAGLIAIVSAKPKPQPAAKAKPPVKAQSKPQAKAKPKVEPKPVPAVTRAFTIVYTSQAYGQIRSCNCTKFRYGGYGRQATAIEQLRKEVAGLVLIECGDALGGRQDEQSLFKADLTLKAMGAMGYSGYVLGEAELLTGIEKLRKVLGESKVDLISANATQTASSAPAGKPLCIYKTANGVRVAVIGVLQSDLIQKETQAGAGVRIDAYEPALREAVSKARKDSDVVVVVAHCEPKQARAIAESGVADVVMCTHIERRLLMPEKDKNIVDAPTEQLGSTTYLESLTTSNWSFGRLDLEIDPKGKISLLGNRLFYMDRAYDESPAVVALYDDYNQKVQDLTLKQSAKMRADVEAQLRKRGFDPDKMREKNRTHVGAEACKTCHESVYESWSKSQHANAMATLKKTNQEFDPECVSCHTTGHNALGGFTHMKATPQLANVQCESCHGAGKKHTEKPAAGFGGCGEDTCRGCHTDELDPEFDYEVRWKKIAHKQDKDQ